MGAFQPIHMQAHQMYCHLFHVYCLSLQGWYRDLDSGHLCLVMGFCEGGTLSNLLKVPDLYILLFNKLHLDFSRLAGI
jgi:hypothetical protein